VIILIYNRHNVIIDSLPYNSNFKGADNEHSDNVTQLLSDVPIGVNRLALYITVC